MNYSFNTEAAKLYGVDEAIVIHNFQYWLTLNKANNKHQHDGRTWTYNSQQALTKIFEFWSRRQIQRIMKSLISQDVLVIGDFNLKNYDTTTWYAFKNEAEWIEPAISLDAPNGSASDSNDAPNGTGGSTKRVSGQHQTGQPIPDSKPDIKQELKDLSGNEPDEVDIDEVEVKRKAKALEISILEYLNTQAGKKFKPVETNLKLIRARLKQKYTEADLLAVVDAKVAQWDKSRMAQYLRPATLFNDEKFNQYYGELGANKYENDTRAHAKNGSGFKDFDPMSNEWDTTNPLDKLAAKWAAEDAAKLDGRGDCVEH